MSLHTNTGRCDYCIKIIDRYPNFNLELRDWFQKLQSAHPEAHTSCAGRGRMDQEAAFIRRSSRAHYGKSSHNFNAAIDLFQWAATVDEMYSKDWFEKVVAPALTSNLDWYGSPNASFYELPHVELKNWKDMVQTGLLKIVE